MIALSCGIKMYAVRHLVLSQSTRVTDRRTDGPTPKTALAYARAVKTVLCSVSCPPRYAKGGGPKNFFRSRDTTTVHNRGAAPANNACRGNRILGSVDPAHPLGTSLCYRQKRTATHSVLRSIALPVPMGWEVDLGRREWGRGGCMVDR